MAPKFKRLLKPKRPVGGSNFRFPSPITNSSNINTKIVTPVTNQRQVDVANKRKSPTNFIYPPFRQTSNPVGEDTSKFINSNPEVLDSYNRNRLILDGILKLNPNLKTNKGITPTMNTIQRNVVKTLGYPKLPRLSIGQNPAAVKLVDKLFLNNQAIESPAIIKELTKLDSKYKDLSANNISDYLKANYPNMRDFNPKTPVEQRLADNIKNKKKQLLDDRVGNPYGKLSSTGIDRLRNKALPIFKKISNDQTSVLQGLHPALIANRTKPEGKITPSTPYRNNRHIAFENEAKALMEQKNSIISNLDYNNMHLLSNINNKISKLNDRMSSLGLSSKLNNPRLTGDEYFGGIYPNLNTLYKSVKGPKGGIGPNVTGKDIPGFNMGGLISMLSRDELQGMAKSLSPKQIKMLTRQGPR
tara:strand:+ start:610 stop:1854 length:1245 start_codon:yes stop_codon:yes gene_type:complete